MMGFTIRCNQCGNEVELYQTDTVNRIGRNDEKIFSHTNGLACDCGNKVHNNLTKEFFFQVKQCGLHVEEHIIRLQNFTYQLNGYEAVWASGCLSRALGIIDSSLTILELLPIVTKRHSEGYDHLVAMSKSSYSYDNLLSLFHDLLDNIGFMYGVKVLKNSVEERASSFFQLFDRNEGKLSNPSTNENINQTLQDIYENAKEFADRDNQYKHKFSPGLIQLHQPEGFIRSLGSSAGNISDFLDLGAVPTDKAYSDARKIKDEVLYLALSCAVQLIFYDNEGLL
ncbi:hypothetical protein NDK43_07695 [Neobacillus pocheonensis]|uniref:Cthe-2314-like HEPN domain-containing protein n=1 Tax=Neobacillus pocheonensis TaxID=363869 RepID=A0ABT0W8G8_9BACI|nr:hypothetical protein [Neobacillus pocheonensis]